MATPFPSVLGSGVVSSEKKLVPNERTAMEPREAAHACTAWPVLENAATPTPLSDNPSTPTPLSETPYTPLPLRLWPPAPTKSPSPKTPAAAVPVLFPYTPVVVVLVPDTALPTLTTSKLAPGLVVPMPTLGLAVASPKTMHRSQPTF